MVAPVLQFTFWRKLPRISREGRKGHKEGMGSTGRKKPEADPCFLLQYFTLDDAATLALAAADPVGFIRNLSGPVVLDEARATTRSVPRHQNRGGREPSVWTFPADRFR
jgi:hypothetical protein